MHEETIKELDYSCEIICDILGKLKIDSNSNDDDALTIWLNGNGSLFKKMKKKNQIKMMITMIKCYYTQ